MLGKLLKHELYATGRIMLPLLGALIVLAGLANLSFRGVENIESNLITIALVFVIAAFFLGLFAVCVMSIVLMVQRFYKNLMGDEGYLTLTLPASLHSVLWAKLLIASLWIILTGIVATVLFLLTVAHVASFEFGVLPDFFAELRRGLQELTAYGITGGDWALLIIGFVLLVILSCFAQCLHFYAAMGIGHCFDKDKVLLSVVFYIAIAFVLRMLAGLSASVPSGAMTLVFGVDNGLIQGPSPADVMEFIHRVVWYSCLTQLIHGAILYAATIVPMKKWLNLA